MSEKLLGVSLVCFPDARGAGAAHRSLDKRLRSEGDVPLQTTVVRVNAHRHASLHDPRRSLEGALTAALTWGAFGLVSGTDRVESALLWGVLGALCGGLYAYTSEHLLTKDELARIGHRLAAGSSALVSYVLTDDGKRLVGASESASPSVASAATIGPDLEARVFAAPWASARSREGVAAPAAHAPALTMILVRYPEERTAREMAAAHGKAAADKKSQAHAATQIELVIETSPDGRRRVSDPSQGVAAMARSDVVSWGAFGLVVGAIVGVAGGGGILGFLRDGLVTGIGWAVFGLAAGALYGLWAGRSISARRLKGLGTILPRGSSALLAWSDGPADAGSVRSLDAPGARHVALSFNPTHGGAVLEVR